MEHLSSDSISSGQVPKGRSVLHLPRCHRSYVELYLHPGQT